MQKILWKGAISFGLVHIPVRLYAAEASHDLDLTMVDRRDFSPIGYSRINKKTGKEVAWENIVKAYEYEPDQYVVLSEEDIKRANVKATQTIDIQAFVDAHEVPITYFERPYYLAPDRGGDKVYALLRETLRRSEKIAIAQFVMRTKQYLVALLPQDDMIVLDTLRYADEIRTAEFELPKSNLKEVGITPKELDMAMTLVDGMTEKWDPRQFHNTFKEDVLAIVDKKIKANQSKTITEPETGPAPARRDNVVDLMALLKQSIHTKSGRAGANSGTVEKPRKSAAHTRRSSQSDTSPQESDKSPRQVDKSPRRQPSVSSAKSARTKSGASSKTAAPRERPRQSRAAK